MLSHPNSVIELRTHCPVIAIRRLSELAVNSQGCHVVPVGIQRVHSARKQSSVALVSCAVACVNHWENKATPVGVLVYRLLFITEIYLSFPEGLQLVYIMVLTFQAQCCSVIDPSSKSSTSIVITL